MNSYGSRNNWDGPGPLPPRWLNCPRKAYAVIDNTFLAFKTPLSNKFDDQIPLQNRFTPKMLFESFKSSKMKIGLWINLTNTKRYYDPAEISANGIKYFKLDCAGHGGAPSEDHMNLFINYCKRFRSQNPTELIGVHCTHGFNRTGFMIAAYLVNVLDCGPDMAIRQFAAAREPGIYKQDYIDEFLRRFDCDDVSMTAPERPQWCNESDDRREGASNGSNGTKRTAKIPAFMEGVDKVYPVTDKIKVVEIQKKIQSMCGFKKNGFPGCQPVSMSRENLQRLSQNPYHVSWKADGTRYMMLIDGKSEIYFADRDNSIFHAPDVEFKDKVDLYTNLRNTLLDGEMVIDVDPQTKISHPRFLIYDCLQVGGKDVMRDIFQRRYDRIFFDIISPRHEAMKRGIIDRRSEPFSVRRKDFWEACFEKTSKLLSADFKQQLSHEPDGLIFHPSNEGYRTGRCDNMLKWKPATHNSIDFKAKIVSLKREGMLKETICELYVGGLETPFAAMHKVSKALKALDGKIIECNVDLQGQYVFMRERTDKSFPNAVKTAEAVLKTIMEPIDENYLLGFLHNTPYKKPDREVMPPPHPPAFGEQHHHKRMRL